MVSSAGGGAGCEKRGGGRGVAGLAGGHRAEPALLRAGTVRGVRDAVPIRPGGCGGGRSAVLRRGGGEYRGGPARHRLVAETPLGGRLNYPLDFPHRAVVQSETPSILRMIKGVQHRTHIFF